MSLLHLDFPSGQTGLYGTNTSYLLNGTYAETNGLSLVEDPDPTTTGNVLHYNSSTTYCLLRKVLPASETTVGFACRLWFPALPADASRMPFLFDARNTGNTSLFSIKLETDGRISAYRGNPITGSGTLLGTSTSPAIVANAWQHIELKVFLDDAAGTIEVRVEGVTVLSLTSQDTLNAAGPCTQIAQGRASFSSGSHSYYTKDWVLWDTAGTLNNDFMSSVAVYELIPDGDISFNWAASSGTTGWNLIDEAPPNDDTDYIYAVDPAPAASKFSLTNLPVDVTTVKGLIAIARSKKTDGGDGNLQVGMVSGASTGLGSDRPITTAYTYWQDVFEVDPATGLAWAPSAVDAAQIQLDRTV